MRTVQGQKIMALGRMNGVRIFDCTEWRKQCIIYVKRKSHCLKEFEQYEYLQHLIQSHGREKKIQITAPLLSEQRSCTGCGICEKVCPIRAISVDNPKNPAEESCLSCMRRMSVCPNGGQVADSKLLEGLVSRIGKALEGHTENEWIFGLPA